MIFNKRTITIILSCAVLLAIIFILLSGSSDEDKSKPKKDGDGLPSGEMYSINQKTDSGTGNNPSVKVKAAKVITGDLVKRVSAYGNAEAFRLVEIQPEKTGIITKINVREGSSVKKGDILFCLDNRQAQLDLKKVKDEKTKAFSEYLVYELDYKSDLSSKSKRLKEAENNLNDARKKYSEGLITKNELQDAERLYQLTLESSRINRDDVRKSETGLSNAEIQVELAELELDKTNIRAPFDGIVTAVNIVEGQHTSNLKEAAMTLVNYDRIKITAEVLENEISALEKGRKVKVDFLAIEKKTYDAVIENISPLVDTDKKTGKVYIHLDNPGLKIKPGMYARVRLDAHIFHDRLLVPRQAVLERDGKRLVFVIRDGKAEWEYVRTGLENEEYIEIIPDPSIGVKGVKEGDLVITDGHFSLAHDTRVRFEIEE